MYTKMQIQYANYTNLVSFCYAHGIALKRVGGEFILLDNPSLNISANEPYKWYRHSTGYGGKSIDFCVKYLNMTFSDAIKSLTNDLPNIVIAPTVYSPYDFTFYKNQKRVIAYLNYRRGIDYQIICYLIRNGLLQQDINGNCVFLVSDVTGNIIPGIAEICGTGSTRFKRYVGIQNGYGFNICVGNQIENVIYFECSIDVLSFYQLATVTHKFNNSLLVSMGGLKHQVVQSYRERYPNAKHITATDDDLRGMDFKYFCNLTYGMNFFNVGYGCKDWNDLLNILR